jgi:hypothetical protein
MRKGFVGRCFASVMRGVQSFCVFSYLFRRGLGGCFGVEGLRGLALFW